MLGRFRTAFALLSATFAFGAFGAFGAFEARAQAQPVIERFDPAERGSRFFAADSLELDGDLRFATGVVMSYGSRLRTFRKSDAAVGAGPEDSRLIENSLWIHPGASLVLAPGARFGLDVPVALQTGTGATLDGTFYPAPSSPAFGDVRGSFDLRLFGRERSDVDGLVVAAGVSAYIPTGASSAYASDDFARVAFRVAGAWQAGPLLAAARVGYMYRKDDLVFAGVRLGGEGNAVLAAGYHRGALVVGPELHGSTVLKTAFDRRSTPLEILGGAHVKLGEVQLGAGLGTAVVTGLGAPWFRGVLSVEWTPMPGFALDRDRDRDGVIDADDMCPDVPGLADGPIGSRGCPAPPLDSDGDGIVDGDDACPQVRGARTNDPTTHGCPEAPRAPEPVTPPPEPEPAPLPAPAL
jgi:OOP family OmpA-OmpF porin